MISKIVPDSVGTFPVGVVLHNIAQPVKVVLRTTTRQMTQLITRLMIILMTLTILTSRLDVEKNHHDNIHRQLTEFVGLQPTGIPGRQDSRNSHTSNIWSTSNKTRNRIIKSMNGNGKNSLKITQWNMGSTFWIRKTQEIQIMIQEYDPDIAIITEANIFSQDRDYEVNIPNYKLILPNTMGRLGNCRVAVLVKEGTNVQKLDRFMNDSVASVWLRVTTKGRKPFHLGAVYREHRWIRQPDGDDSETLRHQLIRWESFVCQWEAASSRADTFVIGDTNFRPQEMEHSSL